LKSCKFRKNQKGGLTLLLTRNYILFSLLLLLCAIGIYSATMTMISRKISIPDAHNIDKYEKYLKSGNYSDISANDMLGNDSSFTILAADGSLEYASSKKISETFSPEELQCIPDLSDSQYTDTSAFTDENGEQRTLVSFTIFSGSTYEKMQSKYILLDQNYRILSDTAGIGEKTLSQKEYALLTQTYNKDDLLSRHTFQSDDGKSHTMLLYMPYYSPRAEKLVKHGIQLGAAAFIAIYIILVLLFVFMMRRKVYQPLKLLDSAFVNLAKGDLTSKIEYSGPREFTRICDSFNLLSGELAESEKKRKLLEDEKLKMLADISHDLKTPITVIQGYTKAINDGLVKTDEQEKYLHVIYQKACALNDLINSFHDYSKIQHPDYKMDKRKIDLCEYSREYFADRYPEFEIAGCSLEAEIPEEPFYYYLDPEKFLRVFDNLISNFFKYSDRGTTLYYRLEKTESGRARMILADNGQGIDPEIAQRLFQPFVVGSEARTAAKGSGLGLAIVDKIVKGHSGFIRVVIPPEHPYKAEFEIIL